MVIDSFFSGGWLSGRFTRDTGVVPVQWIIDPVPGGNVEVVAANDKEDAPEPGPAMSLWMGCRDKRAWGNETEGDRRIIKVSEEGERAVEEPDGKSGGYLEENRNGNGHIS